MCLLFFMLQVELYYAQQDAYTHILNYFLHISNLICILNIINTLLGNILECFVFHINQDAGIYQVCSVK